MTWLKAQRFNRDSPQSTGGLEKQINIVLCLENMLYFKIYLSYFDKKCRKKPYIWNAWPAYFHVVKERYLVQWKQEKSIFFLFDFFVLQFPQLRQRNWLCAKTFPSFPIFMESLIFVQNSDYLIWKHDEKYPFKRKVSWKCALKGGGRFNLRLIIS